MKINRLHKWNVSYRRAVQIQQNLRQQVKLKALKSRPKLIAGADVSFARRSPDLYAAVIVVSLPDLETVEVQLAKGKATFPYIPGLLSFREVPVLLKAFAKLKLTPDAVICDAQGIAHPRGLGLAAHLGLFLDLPTVGCAKSKLVGDYRQVGSRQWASSKLVFENQEVGRVLRTREHVKPVFVSPGHKIDIPGSVKLVRSVVSRYRLPEVTRRAHQAVNDFRRAEQQ